MREVEVLLYEGTKGNVKRYIDGQSFYTNENNLLYTSYGPAMKVLLDRNDLIAYRFLDISGSGYEGLHIDFGYYSYFVEVRFADKREDLWEEPHTYIKGQ